MKKILGALCLLTTLAISMIASPLFADETVAPKRTVTASKYDITKEITLQGTVQSLVKNPSTGRLMEAQLMVSTSQGAVEAHIGSYLTAGPHAMSFVPGQAVKLVGIMAESNQHQIFLVRTIQTGIRTITVRNDRGFLVFPNANARRTVVSTGGAQ